MATTQFSPFSASSRATGRVRSMVLLGRGLLVCTFAMGFPAEVCAQPAAAQAALEHKFDGLIDPAEMGEWIKYLAAEPNNVGSPHDKANANWVAAQMRSWGWAVRIETFWALYPTPIEETLEIVSGPSSGFTATFREPPIPGDDNSTRAAKTALPGYLTYQGDGDVRAPLVYVNYGMPEDYAELERLGISVRSKIVIARYGHGWRGAKAKLAQEHGAIGALIYSDPRDDGYSVGDVYPNGPARPPTGIQHGSVYDQPISPGDPLTPGVGATRNAKRLTRAQATSLVRIPVLPLSYGDARVLLSTLKGPVAPEAWRGALLLTYHVGGDGDEVHMVVRSDWSLKPIYDVIGRLKGSERPHSWVIRGNHRDAWVMGATDPMSGQVAMLAEAKALGQLVRSGWKPKRTIVYASWDGEEPALLGSVEWAEAHAAEIKASGAIYINTDESHRGFLNTMGSTALSRFVEQVSDAVPDPETGSSVGARARAHLMVVGADPHSSEKDKMIARIAADPREIVPLAPGAGSDATAFMYYLGLPTLYVSYDGEGDVEKGAYHSLYDDYNYHARFADPGFLYDAATAKTVGRMVLRLADADIPVQHFSEFAAAVATELASVERLADQMRAKAIERASLLQSGVYRLADDPKKHLAPPRELPIPLTYDFGALRMAAARLAKSAHAYDAALLDNGPRLSKRESNRLDSIVQPLEQRLLAPQGLPGRPWYKNLIVATARVSGNGAVTLPAISESIAEDCPEDAVHFIAITADALQKYADGLDKATAIIDGGS